MSMLLREQDWNAIRSQFTEEEKDKIRMAITGEVICPRGWTIEIERLPESIANKLRPK